MNIDDDSIQDSDELYRRIPDVQIIFDENAREYRPTSKAFQNESNQNAMSVSHAIKLTNNGKHSYLSHKQLSGLLPCFQLLRCWHENITKLSISMKQLKMFPIPILKEKKLKAVVGTLQIMLHG